MSKALFVAIFAATLSSCAQVKYYPYCVFGPDPKIESQRILHKKITDFVRGTIGENARVAISPNDRFVTVEAFPQQHEELSVAWSRVACIGQTRYDVEYRQYKACIYAVDAALRRNGVPPLGDWSDGVRKIDTIYCGQPVNGVAGAVPAKSVSGAEAVPAAVTAGSAPTGQPAPKP